MTLLLTDLLLGAFVIGGFISIIAFLLKKNRTLRKENDELVSQNYQLENLFKALMVHSKERTLWVRSVEDAKTAYRIESGEITTVEQLCDEQDGGFH